MVLILALALATTSTWAQKTWDGGANTGNWGTAGNWDPDSATFGTNVDAVFHIVGTPTGTLQTFLGSAGKTIRSLTFNADSDSDVTIKMDDNAGTGKQFIFSSDTGTSTITVDAGATGNVTVNTSTTGGRAQINNPLIINHNGSGTLTIWRIRENSGNNYSVTKTGTGPLVYGNTAAYYYDGPTLIHAGSMRIVSTSGGFAGGITVGGAGASGTPTLGGTGLIDGDVTIKAAGGGAAGILAPGDASAGTLSLNGTNSLTLESGAKLAYRLGTTSDSVAGVGTLNLNGQVWSDFSFTAGSGFAPGTYVLIAAASVSGTLGGTASGAVAGYTGTLSVDGNNDLILTVSNTPAAVGIDYALVGGQLILDWPAGEGWRLQAQTNTLTVGLTPHWFPVIGATPPYTNAINPAHPAVFYRLNLGDEDGFFVSSAGNDAWDGRAPEYLGGTSGPWRTLAKVNQQMNALRGTNVFFRRGDRFEGRLEIGGTNITFGAYGAGTNLPVLTGARMLTNNWSAVSGRPNLYANLLPADVTEVTVVLRGDTSLPLGRTPNGDLSTNTGYYTFSSRTLSSITDPELTGASGLVGSEIVLRKNNWSYDAHPVTNISGTIVRFDPTDTNDYQFSAAGYFFQKHTNTLDAEGEWFFDQATRKLYVYSTTNPNLSVISYSTEPDVVQITGASGITLQGLGIEMGVSFGINATNSTNVHVLDCAIGRIGRDGVRTYLTTTLIRGNNIFDCLGNGIYSDGQGKPVVITSNLISNIGLIPGRGWNSGEGMAGTRRCNGIMMFSGGSEASYNRLTDIGYVGIHHLSGQNLLRRNVIDRYNRTVFDGGAIYCYQSQSGTVIEENIILNGMASDAGKVPGSSATSTGIQGDAKTANVVIRNNTVAYSQSSGGALQEGSAGIHFNYDSKNNTVVSNTIVVSGNGISTLDRLTSVMSANTFDNNTIVRTTGAQPASGQWAVFHLRDNVGCDLETQGLFRNNVCAVPFTGAQVIYESQASCDGSGGTAFTTWFNTAADWNSARSYASGNLDAPLYVDEATAPPEFIQIYINDSDAPRIFSLPAGAHVDSWGNSKSGSITVAPWRSTVLFKVP